MSERAERTALLFSRALLVLLGTASATITIAGVRSISSLIGPAFLALVLTVTVHPLRGWLMRKRVPGWLATTLITITVYAFLLGFAVSLVVALARFAALLPQYKAEMTSTVDDIAAWLEHLGVDQTQINEIANSFDVGRLANLVGDLLGSVMGLVSDLFFIVMLVLFLAVDAAWFPDRLGETTAERRPLVAAFGSFARGTRSYIVVSTVFGLIVAVIDAGALWVMGIPAPVLWGLLAFLTNYIPNIGFVIGLLPVAVLGLLEGGVGLMIAVIVVYSLINLVIQSVIQPKFVGDAVGLSVTLTFLSLMFWAWVLGALGALLAIPLSLLAKALLVDIDPSTRWLSPLIGDSGPKAEAVPDEVAS